MNLDREAAWATQFALDNKLIQEEDTAVLFQSWNQMEYYLNHLKSAFSKFNCLHAVAVKTNPNNAVLKRIVDLGFGLEAASIEEVELAFQAGIEPAKVVFDSPVKTRLELLRCHHEFSGIIVNANSIAELSRLPENPNFQVGLRINPMQSSDAPEMFDVSTDESKFGHPIEDEENILKAILTYPVTQLHVHIGSSISNVEESVKAFSKVFDLISKANQLLNEHAVPRQITTFDIGGGLLPEILEEGKQSNMQAFASALSEQLPSLHNLKIVTEFGQWIHFYSGYALSNIEYVIHRNNKQIVFLHLGADYLMRDAYYKPRPMKRILWRKGSLVMEGKIIPTDFAGPLCFAGDYTGKNIMFNSAQESDKILFLGTGSNSYGLWSRHCSRKIPKMFGVDFAKRKIEIIAQRQPINF